jgi:hypothetical protein
LLWIFWLVFFWRGAGGVLQGFLRILWCSVMVNRGEVVVDCVVNVASLRTYFGIQNVGQGLRVYFRVGEVRESDQERTTTKANAGILRFAQDDDVEQTTAKNKQRQRTNNGKNKQRQEQTTARTNNGKSNSESLRDDKQKTDNGECSGSGECSDDYRVLGEQFGGQEVAHGFAAPDEVSDGAVYEDFGGAGAGVVVGGLAHAVGAGVEEEDEVSGFDWWEWAVAGEEVSGLADWAYYVCLGLRCG